MYFCIASQRTQFEKAVSFARNIEEGSLEDLTDPHYLASTAKRTRILHSNDPHWVQNGGRNRFEEALNYVNENGGIENVANGLINDPIETRRKLSDAKCNLAPKTASFWYLCLGGKELMTLDTHNYRQIAGLGRIKVNPQFFDGKRRKSDGRNINTTPTMKEYERIERQAMNALKGQDMLLSDSRTDGALVTALFWVAGAKTVRYGTAAQTELFDDIRLAFESPYTKHPTSTL